MNDNNPDSSNSTTERVLAILELFRYQVDGISPVEIQDQLSISRSTLFGVLKELKDLGYLEQKESRGRYFCGPKLKAWSSFQGSNELSLIKAFEEETGKNETAETIALAAPSPNGLVILQQNQSKQSVRAVYQIGDILPFEHSAYRLIDPIPEPSIKQNGFCTHDKEGRFEIGLPVCQNGFVPDVVLLLNVPAYRWTIESLIETWLPELRSMAARISYRLGAAVYIPYQTPNETYTQPKVRLNEKQISDFLQGPWTARLACIRPDGKPHVIPVWQEWNQKTFTILAWKDSQWADFVLQNPSVSLTIDEPWQPLRRVVARGEMQPAQDLSEEERFKTLNRFTLRYLGQSTTLPFLSQVKTIFQFTPNNLSGWMGLTVAES